jgi:hypothetical protein
VSYLSPSRSRGDDRRFDGRADAIGWLESQHVIEKGRASGVAAIQQKTTGRSPPSATAP